MTGWTLSGHTGEVVPFFPFGQGKERSYGRIDNIEQAKNIFEIIHMRKGK